MAKKGKDTTMKRSAAPRIWKIPRKQFRFVTSISPGPHTKKSSLPLTVLVRDVLKLTKTSKEVRAAINSGRILIDGVCRHRGNFPIGLMDVVDIPSTGIVYRLVPNRGELTTIEISDSEKNQKICRIEGKTTIKNGDLQYGLHDGRSIILDKDSKFNVGDSLLLNTPSQKILDSYKLGKDSLAMVMKGERSGTLGTINDIKPGSFSRKSMAKLSINGVETELPVSLLLAVGKDKPPIKIMESA